MANFLAILDKNTDRRSQFLKSVTLQIAPIDGLVSQDLHQGSLSVIWAASPHAPVSISQDDQGTGIIWGEAISGETAHRTTANELRNHWQAGVGRPYDGYYAALTYHTASDKLRVGVDVLGCFPLYYFSHADVVMVGSSPELFQYHPLCHAQVSLEGLVGLLMIKRIVNGQSLWQGIRRLQPGYILSHTSENLTSEPLQYRLPCKQADIDQSGYEHLTFDEQIERLEQALDQAIKRHAPIEEAHTLLLSGGLDSRMLSGYLKRHQVPTTAMTYGRKQDFEALCAGAVADHCGWPQVIRDILPEQQQQLANFAASWEHVSAWGGTLTGSVWNILDDSMDLPPRVVTGLLADGILCGLYNYAYAHTPEDFFRYDNDNGGISAEKLTNLLKVQDVQSTIERVKEKQYECYRTCADSPEMRTWVSVARRDSMRLGIHLWRMSFVAWPRVMVLDRRVLAVSCQLPLSTTSNRRAQKALVKRYFPALAQLPLDRNGFNLSPLQSTSSSHIHKAKLDWRQFLWRIQKKLGWERRYYFRIYNINSPGLKALRKKANGYRTQLQQCFDLSQLEALLPSQGEIAFHDDPIQETKGYLLLLNLLLWMQKHQVSLFKDSPSNQSDSDSSNHSDLDQNQLALSYEA